MFLKANKVAYTEHEYRYVEHGGTAAAASALGVPEHAVVKTLVMEDERGNGLIVLMHGDREVSTKELARFLNVKTISPSSPEQAARRTGYIVGGTSPFGTRTDLPVYAEGTIFTLPRVFINGGRRGFLLSINPSDIRRALALTEVSVAILPV